jgi:protein gp37
MSDTAIAWCDKVWNPTVGCTRVSEGCRACYAFTLHDRRHAAYLAGNNLPAQYAKPFKELQLIEDRLEDPLHWRKPARVFVNSVSDLFHEDVPDESIDRVFAVMSLAQRHTFQVLTKRAQRMLDYCSAVTFERLWVWMNRSADGGEHRPGAYNLTSINQRTAKSRYVNGEAGALSRTPKPPLPNVWLGVSVEDQQRADERIPPLLKTPARVRFLSVEPLLGPVRLDRIAVPTPAKTTTESCVAPAMEEWARKNGLPTQREAPPAVVPVQGHVRAVYPLRGQVEADSGVVFGGGPRVNWIIVGGESGPGHRPMDVGWAESLHRQCKAAGVPVFVKQDSGPRPGQRGRLSAELWAAKEFPNLQRDSP